MSEMMQERKLWCIQEKFQDTDQRYLHIIIFYKFQANDDVDNIKSLGQ